MIFQKKVLLLSLFLTLLGCSQKPYLTQQSAFILLKTPTFKYADMGFIYENKERLKVEIYANANPVMGLNIGRDTICMSQFECMSKEAFNQSVLSGFYPKDTLDSIFRGASIFEAQGLEKKGNGFTQSLFKKSKYQIAYSVSRHQITFHDTINAIKIVIKKQH